MAEAHSAVAFSFAITHEGWDVNFDREVLNLVWQSGMRSWKKRIARFMNSVHNGVYPAHLWTLWVTMTIISAIHFSGYKVPYDLVTKIMPILPDETIKWQLVASMIAALSIWLCIIYAMRYTLKALLVYKGWMYESRVRGSRPSLKTQIWLSMVTMFRGWNSPKLYSFQGSLPKLPVPKLHDTMTRYLASARPLLDDKNYARMERLAAEFEQGIGVKLQRYLVLKSWWSSNYVSDWWEEYVYLRGRSPLMINSNFYGIDTIMMDAAASQAARAAAAIYSCLNYRRLVERQELQPILIQGLIPLCSWQYERIFNTTRIPGVETDKIQHWDDSNHICVYHKGCYYKVVIYKGRLLNAPEIQKQLEYILSNKAEPLPGEEKLAALTAWERTKWANTRRVYFNNGVNKQSLDIVERAAFCLTLDDYPYEYDPTDSTKLDNFGKNLLHGKGYDRWFDKSFTLCVGSNGRLGFNAEHSWGDAAVMSHIWEMVVSDEMENNRADAAVLTHLWEFVIMDELETGYTPEGNCIGEVLIEPPTPQRLKWDMKEDCQKSIELAVVAANELIADIDLKIMVFNTYGKRFMKTCKVSPDAYLQMVLQLAYYRDAGKFSLTYEASMTRLYREGRTETVRPVTVESSAWVKAMCDKNVSVQERVDLLSKACTRHQRAYQDAMCGKGIDRHLFCLYVVSKYLEVDSPFLKEVLSEPWRLSTSQTPHGQTGRMDLNKYPKCISAGGGFGPVADDGYGVSYIIAGEDNLFFHISNKKSNGQTPGPTNCHRFAKQIEQAMLDMRELFTQYKKLQQNGSSK